MFLRFADPYFLFFLLLIPLLVFWYIRKRNGKGGTLRFSYLGFAKAVHRASAERARHVLFVLRIFVLGLLILAFARPQSGIKGEEVITQGVDIILTMDISSSMLAEDIKPNRVDAAKEVASTFVKGRQNDRIGMVVFAGEAYTQCPLTIDYGIILGFLDEIHVGMIEDGTAIGMGLATAVNRLRNSEAKSKVIILLTDGENNRGEIDPITAAQAAQAFDIRIYAVGAGTRGTAMYPVDDPIFGRRYVPMQVNIDEKTLTRIADMTAGQYFRATDREQLDSIYREIDEMEKTEISVNEYTQYSELFFYLVGAAGLLFLGEIGLAHTRFRKIP
ncbi:VWA domain-containing protein [bacterium]|nr:VWA domain-containing protein [bacterium]